MQVRSINTIKVNDVILDIAEDKSVNITVPTKASDLVDDTGFDARITAAQSQADLGVQNAADAANAATPLQRPPLCKYSIVFTTKDA